MSQGWVTIHRKIQDSDLWLNERFSKGQAWVDLILLASHANTTLPVGYKIKSLKRGQLLTSQLKLAERWRWDRKTIRKFLNHLEMDRAITTTRDKDIQHGFTVITITNYEKYQSMDKEMAKDKAKKMDKKIPTFNNVNNVEQDTDTLGAAEATPMDPINPLIKKFENVNPSYQILYKNKAQRAALERLLKTHGQEKLDRMLERLPAIVSMPYAPKVTTPIQLEQKLGELLIFAKQQQGKQTKGFVDVSDM